MWSGMSAPTRYRASMFGRPLGPWRDNKEAARQDAVAAGEGHQDSWSSVAYLSPWVRIEERGP